MVLALLFEIAYTTVHNPIRDVKCGGGQAAEDREVVGSMEGVALFLVGRDQGKGCAPMGSHFLFL